MELISLQSQTSEELQAAIKNYKKSPNDRKTISYLQQQLGKLQELWERFNKTDNMIRKTTTISHDHEYYTSNLFDKVRELFNNTKTKIELELQQLNVSKYNTDMVPVAPSTSLPTISEKAAPILPLKIQKGITAVKQLLVKAEEEQASTQVSVMKLQTIQHHWSIVQNIHEQLWTAADNEYDPEEFFHQASIINDALFKLSAQLGVQSASATSVNHSTNVDIMMTADELIA